MCGDCSILKNLSEGLCVPDLNRTRRSGAKALFSNTMKYACMRLSHRSLCVFCRVVLYIYMHAGQELLVSSYRSSIAGRINISRPV